jgi:hypothetical protein
MNQRPKEGDLVGKNEQLVSQHKRTNAVIICDMIRQQIRLRVVLARLEALPRQKVFPALTGVQNRD